MKLTRPTLFLVTAALLLGGCAQFERNTSPQTTVDDDALCRAEGEPGSPGYVACRKNRDVQSSRAAGSNSRIERSHRNLAEDMLNNPR